MDRLAEAANSTTDPLARQGAFETYTALITEIGHPVEPFVALVLATLLDKCSDKVTLLPIYVCKKAAEACSNVCLVLLLYNQAVDVF